MATNRKPSPGFAQHPDYSLRLEACPRRIRVEFAAAIVADSTDARYLFESRRLPVYYIPWCDLRIDLLEKTALSTHCPFKGNASYWNIIVGDVVAENAVWAYEEPYLEVPELEGLAAFYWDCVDHWYEEDEEIFVHPRDPYSRTDVIPSSREVKIELASEVIARSTRAMFVFETGLPTRYYLPREDVRMDLLTPSASHSRCPYKGIASYWSASIGGRHHKDIAWSYPDPVPECPKIKGLVAFYNENVDTIFVDGRPVEKPHTMWSKD